MVPQPDSDGEDDGPDMDPEQVYRELAQVPSNFPRTSGSIPQELGSEVVWKVLRLSREPKEGPGAGTPGRLLCRTTLWWGARTPRHPVSVLATGGQQSPGRPGRPRVPQTQKGGPQRARSPVYDTTINPMAAKLKFKIESRHGNAGGRRRLHGPGGAVPQGQGPHSPGADAGQAWSKGILPEPELIQPQVPEAARQPEQGPLQVHPGRQANRSGLGHPRIPTPPRMALREPPPGPASLERSRRFRPSHDPTAHHRTGSRDRKRSSSRKPTGKPKEPAKEPAKPQVSDQPSSSKASKEPPKKMPQASASVLVQLPPGQYPKTDPRCPRDWYHEQDLVGAPAPNGVFLADHILEYTEVGPPQKCNPEVKRCIRRGMRTPYDPNRSTFTPEKEIQGLPILHSNMIKREFVIFHNNGNNRDTPPMLQHRYGLTGEVRHSFVQSPKSMYRQHPHRIATEQTEWVDRYLSLYGPDNVVVLDEPSNILDFYATIPGFLWAAPGRTYVRSIQQGIALATHYHLHRYGTLDPLYRLISKTTCPNEVRHWMGLSLPLSDPQIRPALEGLESSGLMGEWLYLLTLEKIKYCKKAREALQATGNAYLVQVGEGLIGVPAWNKSSPPDRWNDQHANLAGTALMRVRDELDLVPKDPRIFQNPRSGKERRDRSERMDEDELLDGPTDPEEDVSDACLDDPTDQSSEAPSTEPESVASVPLDPNTAEILTPQEMEVDADDDLLVDRPLHIALDAEDAQTSFQTPRASPTGKKH